MRTLSDIVVKESYSTSGGPNSALDFRGHQVFPELKESEVRSLARFGEAITFLSGEMLFETGKIARGMFVILAGYVRVYSQDALERQLASAEYGVGQFIDPDVYAVNRYDFEAWRHWSIIEARLAQSRYMLGDEYTLVDMAV
jgi:glutathione S-transferase